MDAIGVTSLWKIIEFIYFTEIKFKVDICQRNKTDK
jgi:hypothetical protein